MMHAFFSGLCALVLASACSGEITLGAGEAATTTDGGSADARPGELPSVDGVIQGCLQQMWDEGPGEPFSANGHYINMSSTQYSMVACGFYEMPNGQIWASQNFQ